MGDKANELGKNLRANKNKADYANKRNKPIIPQIERVRDILDPVVAFELEFTSTQEGHRVLLDVNFTPPPSTSCCEGCFCSACDHFVATSGTTKCATTYAYIPNTVQVFVGEAIHTNFIETSPTLGRVTVNDSGDNITVCYIYDICADGEDNAPTAGSGPWID